MLPKPFRGHGTITNFNMSSFYLIYCEIVSVYYMSKETIYSVVISGWAESESHVYDSEVSSTQFEHSDLPRPF